MSARKKTPAQVLREMAERDPVSHGQRLARAYGAGPEPTVQVPVSLIARARDAIDAPTTWSADIRAELAAYLSQPTPTADHDDMLSCLELGDDGNYHWDTDALDRLLERHMGELPAAPPSIADMVLGTVFTGRLLHVAEDRRWMVTAHGLASSDGSAGIDPRWIDPSTIRDVQTSKEQP